ncbi:MAG: DedA family protein [Proteobacteria bacterium]|jgi:membrane protein YqaA with SNARE-associated domain|nr:YqaA family protein [Alphaproteobacteria bacterium]NCC03591.1 DedA family protein [Pseudomonadota bacterium]
MKVFSFLYDWTLRLSRHHRAPWFLGALSFAESSFFPIPPDVMLAPMCLAMPQKAWRLAALTSIASVLGGMFGYLIGVFAFDLIQPYLQDSHYWAAYETAVAWFKDYGFWAIFVAGFSPIPYKVFTIAAGAMSMAFLPFVIASVIGRGARFFLVAGLMSWGGERMESALRRYVDRLGWAIVALIIAGIVIAKL